MNEDPYKSHKRLFSALSTELPPGRIWGVGFEPTTTTSVRFVRSCHWVRVVSLSTEHCLGADGHVAGVVPIDDIVAQPGFRRLQIVGQGALDVVVARCGSDIE